MNCPSCNNIMVLAKATSFGEDYHYCRTCKKELKELQADGTNKKLSGIASGAALAALKLSNSFIYTPSPSLPRRTGYSTASSAQSTWSPKKFDVVRCLGYSPGAFTKGRLYTLREDYDHLVGIIRVVADDHGQTNGWDFKFFENVHTLPNTNPPQVQTTNGSTLIVPPSRHTGNITAFSMRQAVRSYTDNKIYCVISVDYNANKIRISPTAMVPGGYYLTVSPGDLDPNPSFEVGDEVISTGLPNTTLIIRHINNKNGGISIDDGKGTVYVVYNPAMLKFKT